MSSDTSVALPSTSSYSQASSMQTCSWRYVLERLIRVPQRPSWATVGGSAVHYATEVWDNWTLADEWVQDHATITKLWHDQFDRSIAEREEQEPDFPKAEWRASGRATKAWPNKENEDYWRAEGPSHVMAWVTWRTNNPSWEIVNIAHPDAENGRLVGIEIPFTVPLGGVRVRGYIDRLFHRNETELLCVDLKSGNEPDSSDQLGTYSVALEEVYGVSPTWLAYWMSRTGGTTAFEDARMWPKERVEHLYRVTRAQQERGEFIPKKTRMCSGCSVRDYCLAMNGEKSDLIPTPWEIKVETPEAFPLDQK